MSTTSPDPIRTSLPSKRPLRTHRIDSALSFRSTSSGKFSLPHRPSWLHSDTSKSSTTSTAYSPRHSNASSIDSASIHQIRHQASSQLQTGLVVDKTLDSWSQVWDSEFESRHQSATSAAAATKERRMSAAFMVPEEITHRRRRELEYHRPDSIALSTHSESECLSPCTALVDHDAPCGSKLLPGPTTIPTVPSTSGIGSMCNAGSSSDRTPSLTLSALSTPQCSKRVPSVSHSEDTMALGDLEEEEESGSESEDANDLCIRQRRDRCRGR